MRVNMNENYTNYIQSRKHGQVPQSSFILTLIAKHNSLI